MSVKEVNESIDAVFQEALAEHEETTLVRH